LRYVSRPPASLTIQGGSVEAEHAIAVIGSRDCTQQASTFAHELASALAQRGAVVVSGGALGIDGAAHQGALDAGGRTWVVAPTGYGRCFPTDHADLFAAVGRGPGAMIWPFGPGYHHRTAFLARNRVLVALADAVVVVQAGYPSGALRAASCARTLGRPVWVVPAPPWLESFEGSRRLLAAGVRPLTSVASFLAAQGLDEGPARSKRVDPNKNQGPARSKRADPNDNQGPAHETAVPQAPTERTRLPDAPGSMGVLDDRPDGDRTRRHIAVSRNETRILRAISSVPLHLDAIAAASNLGAQAVAAALLTLALENVVVEGPPGFFRRRNGR
jgi:DNA processing protein